MGLAIANALGHAGARVLINDLHAQAAEDAVNTLHAQGIEARAACFDVADMAAVQTAAHALDTAGWSVDILVSNAGNQNRKALVEMRRENGKKTRTCMLGVRSTAVGCFCPACVHAVLAGSS